MSKNVAIIGSGHIARDLFRKIKYNSLLDLYLVAGRNPFSEGMQEAKYFSKHVSAEGIKSVIDYKSNIDVTIDCTSAEAHLINSNELLKANIPIIDLTPSGIGKKIIPTVNLEECKNSENVNLISCGGQSSIPILYEWYKVLNERNIKLKYVEIASTISTKSAGMATRRNIDNYIENTESAVSFFCNCNSKVILNVNPAEPPVTMKTSFSALIDDHRSREIDWLNITRNAEIAIQKYVPGYQILVNPKMIEDSRLFASAVIQGKGDYLPKYSGNLDIITSAAISVAEIL